MSQDKNYVYLYSSPDFVGRYAGRDSGRRCFVHLANCANQQLCNFLNGLREMRQEPEIDVIVSDLNVRQANAIERFWVAVFGREDKQTGTLFNETNGGQGSEKGARRGSPSEQHRRNLSLALRGKPKKNPPTTAWSKGLKLGPRDAQTKDKLKASWAKFCKLRSHALFAQRQDLALS